MKIKAIIFDLGKVVFDLSFDRIFQSWANTSRQEFQDIKRKFVFNNLFDQLERNEISSTDFRASISETLSMNLTDEDFDKGWCDLYLDVYYGIEKILIELKYRYRLVALTNTNIIHNKIGRLKYADVLQHFEKIFSSYEMQTRKPEEKAYRIVLDYLQCQPAETVFLDDNIENINGAKKIGITSILVTSQQQMKEELHALGLIYL